MKKMFRNFKAIFALLSIVIIIINLMGKDTNNTMLIDLNPIINYFVYTLKSTLFYDTIHSKFIIYIIHFITFIIYGAMIDIIFSVFKAKRL